MHGSAGAGVAGLVGLGADDALSAAFTKALALPSALFEAFAGTVVGGGAGGRPFVVSVFGSF